MNCSNDEVFQESCILDSFLKEVGGNDYIRCIPITLAHFCFRNGPVEDMHADGKLSQEDMKTLNKYMVDRLGLFFLLLGLADSSAIKRITSFDKLCGTNWDDPDIGRMLEKFRIDPERIRALRKAREESLATAERPERETKGLAFLAEVLPESHTIDEKLKNCPICGSNILLLDARTSLSSILMCCREIGTNKALAKAAGVPVQLVTDMQFVNRVQGMIGRQKGPMEKVAETLGFPLDDILRFNPYASTIRCDECQTSAPWFVWNSRKA